MSIKTLTDRFRPVPPEMIPVDKARRLLADLKARDAEIARLQDAGAELEATIETREQELQQARFKNETLERSYATQLQAARERAETAEAAAAEKEPRIKDLEIALKLLQRKFDDAQARLDMFGPETASIDELLAGSTGAAKAPLSVVDDEPAEHAESQILGDMIDPSIMLVRTKK